MTSRSMLPRIVQGACIAALALSLTALVGWSSGMLALTNGLPGYPAMNPVTALSTLLLGASLWIGSNDRLRPRFGRLAPAFAGAVVVVAGIRFVGLLLRRDIPVDLMMFADAVLHAPISARMGVHSSLALLAVGSGLLTLDLESTQGWRIADLLLFLGLGVALAALVGYFYAALPMHGLMSIHTAVGLFLLGVAALLTRPDRGLCGVVLSRSSGGVMARRVLPIATLVPLFLGWLRLEAQRHGYVSLEIGTAFLVLAIAGLMVGLVWVTGRSLALADVQRAGAATALRRSIERQNQMLEMNLIGVLTTDRHGMILEANRTFLEMTGYRREDLPLSATVITPPEWRGLTTRALDSIADHGSVTPFEKEYLRKDGSRVAVLVGAAVLPDDPDHVLAFVVDLSSKRSAELQVGRLQLFLDSIIENLPNMVFVKDAEDLKFVRLNRAGEELLGVPRAALLGKSDYDLFPRDEADFFTSKDRQVLEGGVLLDIPEEPIQTQQQGMRILHTKKVPIHDEDGSPRYLLGISEDITDRKNAERERAELTEGLRRRTLELEAANQELEAFSYSVSHDLRAPLRHIDGFSDLLARNAREGLDDKGRRYLDAISASAKSMGHLIDDLLAFSRMSRSQMQQGPVELDALVTEVRRELEMDLAGRTVEWRIGSLPQVRGDRAMLRLVFTNLLSNAVKYSRGRERTVIEVGADATDEEAIVCVRDNGVGFDMKYQNKLFGVFQRLHRDDEFEGTGIGLATVRRVLHRHGGRAWAEGEVDRGAAFFVAFPRQAERLEIREAA